MKKSLPKLLIFFVFVVLIKAGDVYANADNATLLSPGNNTATGTLKQGRPIWFKFGVNENTKITLNYQFLEKVESKLTENIPYSFPEDWDLSNLYLPPQVKPYSDWHEDCRINGSIVKMEYYIPNYKNYLERESATTKKNEEHPYEKIISHCEHNFCVDYFRYNTQTESIVIQTKSYQFYENFDKNKHSYIKIDFDGCYNIDGVGYTITVDDITNVKAGKQNAIKKIVGGIARFFVNILNWLFPKDPCTRLPKPYNKTYSKSGAGVAKAARDLFQFAAVIKERVDTGKNKYSNYGAYSKFKCGPHYGLVPETGMCGENKNIDCSTWGPYDTALPQKARDMYGKGKIHPKGQINYLQCTSFVAMAYNMAGISMINADKTISGGGHWYKKDFVCAYKNKESKRYPEPGMGFDMPGHVGVISELKKNKKVLELREANTDNTNREFTIKVSDSGKITLNPVTKGKITYYFEYIEFVKEKCRDEYKDKPKEFEACLNKPCSYANQGKLN